MVPFLFYYYDTNAHLENTSQWITIVGQKNGIDIEDRIIEAADLMKECKRPAAPPSIER
ncbi:hypothetical protein UNDYM_5926 (plasmid) [Undibacterium sp. YM2]|nr:hypothetical protein UNDYM_5926 [Undibacterium sp. YM2]